VRKTTGEKIKHHKRRGEWAELRFMAMAAEHGLQVTKPWGEMARYDFAVEYEGQFWRVQVKSTMFLDRGGYTVTVRDSHGGPYAGDPFDFVAAYVIPEDIWYIIPAERIRGQGNVGLYPWLKKSKYGEYKEAWHLLREGRVGMIQACVEGVAFSSQHSVRATSIWHLVIAKRDGLSPRWGFSFLRLLTHGLRRGLYSCAAPRLTG
jgi:hypothetical protein